MIFSCGVYTGTINLDKVYAQEENQDKDAAISEGIEKINKLVDSVNFTLGAASDQSYIDPVRMLANELRGQIQAAESVESARQLTDEAVRKLTDKINEMNEESFIHSKFVLDRFVNFGNDYKVFPETEAMLNDYKAGILAQMEAHKYDFASNEQLFENIKYSIYSTTATFDKEVAMKKINEKADEVLAAIDKAEKDEEAKNQLRDRLIGERDRILGQLNDIDTRGNEYNAADSEKLAAAFGNIRNVFEDGIKIVENIENEIPNLPEKETEPVTEPGETVTEPEAPAPQPPTETGDKEKEEGGDAETGAGTEAGNGEDAETGAGTEEGNGEEGKPEVDPKEPEDEPEVPVTEPEETVTEPEAPVTEPEAPTPQPPAETGDKEKEEGEDVETGAGTEAGNGGEAEKPESGTVEGNGEEGKPAPGEEDANEAEEKPEAGKKEELINEDTAKTASDNQVANFEKSNSKATSENKEEIKKATSAPKTGDENSLVSYIVLIIAGLFGIKLGKKKQEI